MNKTENFKKFRFSVWVAIIIAIITGWLNLPQKITESIISMIFLGPILGISTSAVAAQFAEVLNQVSCGLLKEDWVIDVSEIFDLNFELEIHIPVFVIVTLITEIWLFS